MIGVFSANGSLPPRLCLIDDGFEGELRHLPEHTGAPVVKKLKAVVSGGPLVSLSITPSPALLTAFSPITSSQAELSGIATTSAEQVVVLLGGPPKNGSGLTIADLHSLQTAVLAHASI